MSKIIEKIWNEELRPAEHYGNQEAKILKLYADYDKKENEILLSLNKSQREHFENLLSDIYALLDLHKLDAYEKGFSLAGDILMELFHI